MSKIGSEKKLVLVTASLFIMAFGFILLGAHKKPPYHPDAISIDTREQPTIGHPRAQVQVVVFEEPKCSNCKEFNKLIFPKLKEEFIDTSKILYTVIPVSFLPNSMSAAEALLCVYLADPLYPNSDLFFTYLDYIYSHQPEESVNWTTTDKLLEFAKNTSPSINLSHLRSCVDNDSYRIRVQKNTEYGSYLMGGTISTPTIYVDGIKVNELTYDNVKKLIQEVIENK